MTPTPPDLPDARRSRVPLLALVPIALGALILVGGALAGLVFALRAKPPVSAAVARGIPAKPAPIPFGAPPRGVKPPPRLAPPELDDTDDGDEDDADPGELTELPNAPVGDNAWPDESSALLPLAKGQAVWGVTTAQVTLALFGDLQCEHTRAELRTLARLAAERAANVRLVFYHRPLAEHADAEGAALVLAATALQMGNDATWRVLSVAARSHEAPSSDEISRWLSASGVTASRESLARDPLAAAQIESDRALASKLNVRETPTLFVNGQRVIGRTSRATLERLVDEEVRTMRWLAAQGISGSQAYARRVRKNLIGVGAGVEPRACVAVDKAPSQGASSALVTIVEFSDFECEACRALEPTLAAIVSRHTGVVRRAWKSFALPQHRHAPRAAAFALAARELGGDRAFWTMHSALLGLRSAELDDEQLRRVAGRLGLDAERLLSLADQSDRAEELAADQELAKSLGLDGAPTLFVNGRKLVGAPPAEALEAVVREEMEAARRAVKAGNRVDALLCDE